MAQEKKVEFEFAKGTSVTNIAFGDKIFVVKEMKGTADGKPFHSIKIYDGVYKGAGSIRLPVDMTQEQRDNLYNAIDDIFVKVQMKEEPGSI